MDDDSVDGLRVRALYHVYVPYRILLKYSVLLPRLEPTLSNFAVTVLKIIRRDFDIELLYYTQTSLTTVFCVSDSFEFVWLNIIFTWHC